MYIKPTEEQIQVALDNEWSREQAERGYDIFEYNNTGLLDIERIDCEFCGFAEDGTTEVCDEDCAREAERTGFCKIIPIEELPKGFRWPYHIWVDTPENREAIKRFCEEGKVKQYSFDILVNENDGINEEKIAKILEDNGLCVLGADWKASWTEKDYNLGLPPYCSD